MRNYTVETFVDRMGSPPIPEGGILRTLHVVAAVTG